MNQQELHTIMEIKNMLRVELGGFMNEARKYRLERGIPENPEAATEDVVNFLLGKIAQLQVRYVRLKDEA